MKTTASIIGLLLAAVASVAAAATGPVPMAASTTDYADGGQVRVIVKLRHIGVQHARPAIEDPDVVSLASRTGVPLRQSRRIEPRLRVLDLGVVAAPGSIEPALECCGPTRTSSTPSWTGDDMRTRYRATRCFPASGTCRMRSSRQAPWTRSAPGTLPPAAPGS